MCQKVVNEKFEWKLRNERHLINALESGHCQLTVVQKVCVLFASSFELSHKLQRISSWTTLTVNHVFHTSVDTEVYAEQKLLDRKSVV